MPLNQELNDLFSRYAKANKEEQKNLQQIIRAEIANRNKNTPLDLYGLAIEGDNSKIKICDLDLSSLDLSGIHFSGMELYNVKFDQSDLSATSFSGKDRRNRMIIKNASFNNAACIQTVFSNVDLRNSTFIDTQFEDPSFCGSWLSKDILKILVPKANYKSSTNGRPQINLKNTSYEDEDLRGLNLSELYLHGCYFKGANLQGVSFYEADIKGAVFKGAQNIGSGQFYRSIHSENAYFDSHVQSRQAEHTKAVEGTKKITHFFTLRTTQAGEGTNAPINEMSNEPKIKKIKLGTGSKT